MPGPPTQPRYNAKARGSVAGGSHKRRKRPKQVDEPLSEPSGRGHMSAKKRKRLDSYITKKLKNDEKAETLKLLASLTPSNTTLAALASSSTLGQKPLAPSSAQERADVREDMIVRRGIDRIGPVESDEEVMAPVASKAKGQSSWNLALLSTQPDSDSSFDSSDSENDEVVSENGEAAPGEDNEALEDNSEVAAMPVISGKATVPRSLGGALKANVNGQTTTPRIVPRRQKMPLGRAASAAGSSSDESGESEAGSSSGSESNEPDYNAHETSKPRRSLGFKSWALKQMGKAPTPASPPLAQAPALSPTFNQSAKPQPPTFGPLGTNLVIPSLPRDTSLRPTISRRESVSASRLRLPILAEEQPIVEAIRLNPVVIIAGETGSGKTTQVPQMLYEAGFGFKVSATPGMIAVTQPRRVAAVSLSARVRDELNSPAPLVAHQIRYSSTTSPDTCIKFMTDGVLLREMATDFLLSRYSVVVVDEAHERGVNTDVLIGLLSRVAKLRQTRDNPLRIVIMSATLRISEFSSTNLFPTTPPVIHIPARQYPVTTHFARRTLPDYLCEAYKKVCKIHARLPPGGILVFLTGQAEIQGLCKKLGGKFGATEDQDVPLEPEDIDLGQDLATDVDGDDDPDSDTDSIPDVVVEEAPTPMHILPLYSLLPHDQQMRVFQPPPPGHRLVIVATNVAETSITIPGIRYVVDSGRSKERHYASGVQSFSVSWISKASAAQRAGRAGRTAPGHVYRLYSSALYEDHFDAFSTPEILRMPIEGVVLQMKSMNIDSVVNFPFPTPPDRPSLARAETLLTTLGALQEGRITPLGNTMAEYPVSPRFAKMLAIGNQHDCLPLVIAIVACLSVGDPFIHEQNLHENEGQESNVRSRYFKAQSQFFRPGSDLFSMLTAVGAYEHDPTPRFCSDNFLRHKAMTEIQQLRQQISRIAKTPLTRLAPPSPTQLKILRQIILASSLDHVAVRLDIAMKQRASFESCRDVPYRTASDDAYIHPSSTHFHHPPPEFLVYQEITRGEKKTHLRDITTINPAWLSELGASLCTWSKPESVKGTQVGMEREVWLTPHFLGVDLPPKKVKQKREGTRWVYA